MLETSIAESPETWTTGVFGSTMQAAINVQAHRAVGADVNRTPRAEIGSWVRPNNWRGLIVVDLRADHRGVLGRLFGDHLAPRRVLRMEPLAAGERFVRLPGPRAGGDRLARACPRAGLRPDPWADQGHLGRLVVADFLGCAPPRPTADGRTSGRSAFSNRFSASSMYSCGATVRGGSGARSTWTTLFSSTLPVMMSSGMSR
jgi:hypothetical protein